MGFRREGGNSGRPLILAISTNAVRPSSEIPYCVVIFCISGLWATSGTVWPWKASVRISSMPSPPSATGKCSTSHCGKIVLIPCSAASSASRELKLPLKESIATTILFMFVTD